MTPYLDKFVRYNVILLLLLFPRKVEVIKCTVKVRWENFKTYLSRISYIAFSRFVGTSFSLPAFSHPALSISST